MDTQLKKGVLEMCVLHQLSAGDRYGYELMKVIQDVFPDVYDGSIYAILRRLNGEGATQVYLADVPSGGPARKYYHLTPQGRDMLDQLAGEWDQLQARVRLLGIGSACIDRQVETR